MKLERDFQAEFIKKLREEYPQAIILKNDSSYQQGILDWLILEGPYWAMLEIKRKKPTRASDWRPNQPWFLAKAAEMSFAACVYPENEQEVLHALRSTLRPRRSSRQAHA